MLCKPLIKQGTLSWSSPRAQLGFRAGWNQQSLLMRSASCPNSSHGAFAPEFCLYKTFSYLWSAQSRAKDGSSPWLLSAHSPWLSEIKLQSLNPAGEPQPSSGTFLEVFWMWDMAEGWWCWDWMSLKGSFWDEVIILQLCQGILMLLLNLRLNWCFLWRNNKPV